jgi:hypothetical protein
MYLTTLKPLLRAISRPEQMPPKSSIKIKPWLADSE